MAQQSVGGTRSWGVGSLRDMFVSLGLAVLAVTLMVLVLRAAAVASAPAEITNLGSATCAPTATHSTATVHIAKTVHPNPFHTSGIDPGGPVSICFTITRRGLDVVLVHDVSGSMGEWLTDSKVIAAEFVSYLQSTDRAAVVPFSITAYLTQPLTTDLGEVMEAVDRLAAGGNTNVGEGISVSHKELITSPRYVSDTIKTLILLSDGKANRPVDEETARQYARDRAEAAAGDEVRIYTIGFGSDADEELLREIADIGSGGYFFAPDGDVLETIYLTIALELHNLVITDVLTADVEAYCPSGAPYSCAGSAVTWPVSDSSLASNPLSLCFGATVTLPCYYHGPVNDPDASRFCYQSVDGEIVCDGFDNPAIIVVCRRVYMPIVMDCYSPRCSPGIVNGGLEDGWDPWTHDGELSQTIVSTDPHSGSFSARLGDPAYKCSKGVPTGSAWMEQTTLVPCAGSPKLSFWYSITTYDENDSLSNRWDLFEVMIDGSQVFKSMPPGTGHGCKDPPKETGWVSKTIDLGDYRGLCVTIRFANWNWPDHQFNTWTQVDDVDVQVDP